MANLLSNLGDLSVHHLLMGSHGLKLGVKLVDGRSQYLIDFWIGSLQTVPSCSPSELWMVEVEVEVVGHRVLRVGSLVGAWYFEEVGWALCMGGWSDSFPLG